VTLRARSLGAIDAGSGTIAGALPLAVVPDSLSADANTVWVADRQKRVVIAVDRAHLRVTHTLRLPSTPYRLVAGGGRAWVGNAFDGSVSELAGSGELVRRFRPQPASVGRLALAYGAGSLWVGSQDDAVARVDPSTGRTIAVIDRVVHPEAVSVGAGAVWVAQATRSAVIRIDPRTNRVVASVPLGGTPTALAAGEDAVWVLTSATNKMWRIDANTNAVTAVVDVESHASDVAIAGGSVWVSAPSGTLLRFSLRRQKLLQTVALGHAVGGMVATDGRLWIGVR
jgi:DNA-binding beta-propeller fold protein YncE